MIFRHKNMVDILTALAFVASYALFFLGLKPLLFSRWVPIAMDVLFLVMLLGPAFMMTLFFRGYLAAQYGKGDEH